MGRKEWDRRRKTAAGANSGKTLIVAKQIPLHVDDGKESCAPGRPGGFEQARCLFVGAGAKREKKAGGAQIEIAHRRRRR